MSDEEKKPDPVEQAAKNEAEDRLKAEDEAARVEAEAKKCETPKKQEPLKKLSSGKGRGLSLAGNRKKN